MKWKTRGCRDSKDEENNTNLDRMLSQLQNKFNGSKELVKLNELENGKIPENTKKNIINRLNNEYLASFKKHKNSYELGTMLDFLQAIKNLEVALEKSHIKAHEDLLTAFKNEKTQGNIYSLALLVSCFLVFVKPVGIVVVGVTSIINWKYLKLQSDTVSVARLSVENCALKLQFLRDLIATVNGAYKEKLTLEKHAQRAKLSCPNQVLQNLVDVINSSRQCCSCYSVFVLSTLALLCGVLLKMYLKNNFESSRLDFPTLGGR